MSKTDKIFLLNAPYDNSYQGDDLRLVFVCSAGILRSATAANLYAKKGYNTRSCGTHEFALIPLSVNLIMWADRIIFMNPDNHKIAQQNFMAVGYEEDIDKKAIILTVEDDYDYNEPKLIAEIEKQMAKHTLVPKRIARATGGYY